MTLQLMTLDPWDAVRIECDYYDLLKRMR
jgi:hypothetical protein